MDLQVRHPLLCFTTEDVIRLRKEVGVTKESLNRDIDAIVAWFNKQAHLVDAGIDRDVIERMLLINKGSIEKTKLKIEGLYTQKALSPELSAHRDTLNPELDGVWEWMRYVVMPEPWEGKRITIIQYTDPDVKKFNNNLSNKLGFMIAEIRLKYDYTSNDVYILDLKNTSMGHLMKLNPLFLRKAALLFEEGISIRIHSIHSLNAPPFIDKLIFILKQVLKPKLMEKYRGHASIEDLHQAIPKKYLPRDYGGDQKSMAELAEHWRSDLRSADTRQFLMESSKRISDESKRVACEGQSLNGTFRRLEVD